MTPRFSGTWGSQRRTTASPLTAPRPARGISRGRQLPARRPDMRGVQVPAATQLPRPRLLALDVDGTVLDERGLLRPVVRDAIAAVSATGVLVLLATGRSPWDGVGELAAELGLDGPQITMQGALIADPETGSLRRLRALSPDVFLEAVAFARELGLDPVATMLDGHRAERVGNTFDSFWLAKDGAGRFTSEPDLTALASETPIRLFLPTGPARHWSVRLAASERFLGRASVVWSDDTGIELLARGVNKGEAVAWLAAGRGVALDEVAAVGDAPNDKTLLRVAGRSAAMGSAPADVRDAADITVRSSADDGLVDALRWFFPDLADVLGVEPLAAGMHLLA
jgi:Cof subfamily protein (haloacid dehalogenase superfamily)